MGYARPMARTRWLDPDEMRAWRTYSTTSVDLMKALEADVAPYGITMGDYQLLAMISEAPDSRLRLCDLADQLRLTRRGRSPIRASRSSAFHAVSRRTARWTACCG